MGQTLDFATSRKRVSARSETAGQLITFKGARLKDARLADERMAHQRQPLSTFVVSSSVRCIDFLIVSLLGLAIAHIYVNETSVLQNSIYLFAAGLVAAATVIAFELFDLYGLRTLSANVGAMPAIAFGWTATFAVFVAGMFFLKIGPEGSRIWLAVWFAAGGTALLRERLMVGRYLRKAARLGWLNQRVAICGAGDVTQALIGEFEADTYSILRIAGIFDDRHDGRAPRQIAGYPDPGGLENLIAMDRSKPFDLVVVSLPLASEDRLSHVMSRLSILSADVKMPARATPLRFSPRTYSHVVSVAMIDIFDKPIADLDRISNRLFDKFIGTLALAILAPVMLFIALTVKLESHGPILFRQKRCGFNNERIEILKFRSMYGNRGDAAAYSLVAENDPRVTRVGRFLRKTGLDELPQLINVVKGDLSLTGPQPHALQTKAGGYLHDTVVDGYFARH